MEERRYYVYEYYIVNTGEIFYVGKGTGNRYKTLRNRNKFFLDMYHAHDCRVRIIFQYLTEEEAYFLEYDRIFNLRLKTSYRLTNQTDGGDGTRGFVPSESHGRKVSQALKERWASPQYAEWRNEIIASRQDEDGIYKSKDFREKISSIVKGESNPNYGNYWSQEKKQNVSQKMKDSGCHKGTRNGRHKKIMCVETGEVFDYIALAQEKYNVKYAASFSIAIDNPNRTAAGLHWVSVNQ